MNRKKIIVSILLITAVFTASAIAIGKTLFSPTSSEVADRIKAGITDDETTLATVNENSISRKEVEIEKARNSLIRENIQNNDVPGNPDINKHPIDDTGVIKELAKKILFYAEVEAAGLSVTDEQIKQKYEQDNKERADRVNNGDETAKSVQEENDSFLKELDMTADEYYNLVYKNILKESMVMTDFALYYSENIYPETQLSIDDYLHSLLEKSDLKILK